MIGRAVRRIRALSSTAMLRGSAVLTIVALGLMVWSLVDPTVLPVMLAMSVGQMFGTVAFTLYLIVIIRDLRRERREKRESLPPPISVAPIVPLEATDATKDST